MTGTRASSMVRFGPSKMKSAPAARAIDALCIDMCMLDIAVGEDDLVDCLPPADLGQVALVEDRNAVLDIGGQPAKRDSADRRSLGSGPP